MNKLALIAFTTILFISISCKQEPKVQDPTTAVKDSVMDEKIDVPAADSVKRVTLDSSKIVNHTEVSTDSVVE